MSPKPLLCASAVEVRVTGADGVTTKAVVVVLDKSRHATAERKRNEWGCFKRWFISNKRADFRNKLTKVRR